MRRFPVGQAKLLQECIEGPAVALIGSRLFHEPPRALGDGIPIRKAQPRLTDELLENCLFVSMF